MEQVFDSEESSSGCESGWTLYLQHFVQHDDLTSKKTSTPNEHDQQYDNGDEDDVDDDDMSMVSDASSGPPHFLEHDEDEYCNNDKYNSNSRVLRDPTLVLGSRKRPKILKQTSFDSHSHRHLQDLPAFLDDTASSSLFGFTNNNFEVCNKEASMDNDDSFDYSQGHSTTYF